MKVHELAKELSLESKDLIAIIQGLDIDVKSHLSTLDDGQVEKIKIAVGGNIKKDVVKDVTSKTPTQQEIKRQPTQWKPDLNRMICIKNIASGKLIYKSKRQIGYTIEWPKKGDQDYMELGEFISLKNTDRRFVTEPWIRIMEDDEIEILKYAQIFNFYKEILGLDNVSDILKLDFKSFQKKFDKLPDGYKNSVIESAAKMLNSGELDSIKIKNYIEQTMGIDLSILIRPEKSNVDNSFNIK